MVKLVEPEWGRLGGETPLSSAQIEQQAETLLNQMTLDEKIGQMSGDIPLLPGLLQMAREYNTRPIPAGENLRLGIPGIRFSDGPRGVVMYNSTCFPVSMARGASWDVSLEEQIGDAIGVEARAQGANFFGGVCINLLRHPAWGRAQETYGEDPHHLGEMGAALVRGVQRHIMACIKHYACNSVEKNRLKIDVKVSQRTLREVYLPHFKRCVEEGAAAVMSAYNQVNGAYCGHNRPLLTEILKEEWGFQGFVISDFVWGIRDGKQAALAGLDIEMPFTQHYGRRLKRLVESGQVPQGAVDAAVRRILRQKLRFSRIGEPERYRKESVAGPEHRALARLAAQKCAVLLKNDPAAEGENPLLPIDPARIKRIAVLGKLADLPNTGDLGSSHVRAPYVVTPLEGLRAGAPAGVEIIHTSGEDPSSVASAASRADLVIVVAGCTSADEGEYVGAVPLLAKEKGGDRLSLALSHDQEALIQQAAATNPRIVVVLVGGSAFVTEAWRSKVPALLVMWYAGMEGGSALADLLFGRANPSGKLPCVFPCSADQLPFFDRDAAEIEYDLWHGYRLLDRSHQEPAFAFGFGLSYTRFALSDVRLERDEIHPQESLAVSAVVANTGQREGEEVVQLYAGCVDSAYERPRKELKGFQKVHLAPGEQRKVHFSLPASALAVYDESHHAWMVEPGKYRLWVGNSARAQDLIEQQFTVLD